MPEEYPTRYRDNNGDIDEVSGLIIGAAIAAVIIVAVVLLLVLT